MLFRVLSYNYTTHNDKHIVHAYTELSVRMRYRKKKLSRLARTIQLVHRAAAGPLRYVIADGGKYSNIV